MASYKKNNYRPNRNKPEEQPKNDQDFLEKIPENVEQDSTTAQIFNTLNETANETESWVIRHQKIIFGIIGTLIVFGIGYMLYDQLVKKPSQNEASNELSYPMQTFEDALNATETKVRDSLFLLSLNGSNGRYGFVDIIKKYSGTKAKNIATYSAGMAYLHLNKYKEAIEHLDKFSSDDEMLSSLALGNIGDAFAQLKQPKDALDYYEKAFKNSSNGYTAPIYLNKAALVAIELKQYDKALEYFEKIQKDHPQSEEARTSQIQINRVKTLKAF